MKDRTKEWRIERVIQIPDNFKIVFRFYELIFVSYLLLNNYRKHFFWNVNEDFDLQNISHHPSQKNTYCFIPLLWPCYLPPLSLDYYISYENSSIEQVWVSEWSVGMFTIPAYKERHEGGRSHRPVIMESTLLSAYHRLSDPNKCILSSLVYLALLLAFLYRNVKDDWERPGMWRSY